MEIWRRSGFGVIVGEGAQWCQALSAPHSASQRDTHSARGPAVVPGNAPTPALNLGPNWASHDAIRHSPSSTVQAPNHWAFFCPSSWNGMDPPPPHVRCKVLRSLPQCPCRSLTVSPVPQVHENTFASSPLRLDPQPQETPCEKTSIANGRGLPTRPPTYVEY